MTLSDPTREPKPQLNDKERFRLEYKIVADDIRHYSTTRSALTSFLMTVGLTLLAYYFSNNFSGNPLFLVVMGIVLLAAALFVCLKFSYETERNKIHLKALWAWSEGKESKYPGRSKDEQKQKSIWAEVWGDWMNWALIMVVLVTIVTLSFCGIAGWIACRCR